MPALFCGLEYPVWQAPLFLALLQPEAAKRSIYMQTALKAIFQRLLELVDEPEVNEGSAILEAIRCIETPPGGAPNTQR